MDRLFGRFQLGEIKVNEKSSFPPDAPEAEPHHQEAPQPAPAGAAPIDGEEAPWRPAELQSEQPLAQLGAQPAVADAAHGPGPELAPPHAAEAAGEDRVVAINGARAYRPGYGQGTPESRGEVLKVSARSRPSAVAGAIAGVVRENGRAEVQAIGAGAANQAIKAVAIARDYLNETGIEAICLPSLVDLTIDEADRTAIRLVVETR